MDWPTAIDLLTAFANYAWPAVVLIGLLIFRSELRGLVGRIRKGKFLGQEFELDPAAQALRTLAAEDTQESPSGDESAVDRAAVLESTAAVLEARTEDERNIRLEELRRKAVSPMQRAKQATDWVIQLERQHGRDPYAVQDGRADLQSGDRLIEVKVTRSRGLPYIRLSNAQVDLIREVPEFYVYVVLMDDDDPSTWAIKILDQQLLLRTLEEGRYFYEIPSRALLQLAPGPEAL